VQQCRVPIELFRTVTARTPDVVPSDAQQPTTAPSRTGGRVVSLLHRPDPT